MYHRQIPGGNHQVGYRLNVSLKADAKLGIHKHNLYLKTNDPSTPMVPVLVEANIQSLIQVNPAQLDLGVVKNDSTYVRRVVVRGSQPFQILGVDGTGNGIELGGAISDRESAGRPLCDLQVSGHQAWSRSARRSRFAPVCKALR